MCGIAGYVGQGNRSVLEAMVGSIKHRGPDATGVFVSEICGLGHCRLAIIDCSDTGAQPMTNRAGTITIIFNGEIYNFLELRTELIAHGCKFTGHSDTEVLLYLYEVYGVECFKKLNGMFAIALYDHRTAEVILVRDRFGEKPLYWFSHQGGLIFASELKSLRKHPQFSAQLDYDSVGKYICYDYVPTPHTIYQNVQKLKPGHFLIYKKGVIELRTYFTLTFPDPIILSKKEINNQLDRYLEKSVTDRLVSDVPIGIFLSGGLDSSLISYYAQKNSAHPIKTFCIGFKDRSFDEREPARVVAKHLGTDHYEDHLSATDALGLINELPYFYDEPLADYSCLPTLLLARFARKQVTVALGGDGGDELFLGYPTMVWDRYLPEGVLGEKMADILRLAQRVVPRSHNRFSLDFKINRLLAGMSMSGLRRHQAWLGTFPTTDVPDILLPEIRAQMNMSSLMVDTDTYEREVARVPRVEQLTYWYLKMYLMDQVLVKMDRATMASGLETRAPFLDYNLVDFVSRIPYTQKIKGLTTKHLLRTLAVGKLPTGIINRPKQGFGVPLSEWLQTDLKGWVTDILSVDSVRAGGIFDPVVVERILKEHFSGKKNRRKEIWSLAMFTLWQKYWNL